MSQGKQMAPWEKEVI